VTDETEDDIAIEEQTEGVTLETEAEQPGQADEKSKKKKADTVGSKLYCPIRGQLKVAAKAKDQLTPTEEKLRIDCIRFLLKKNYPKDNFKVETTLLRFGNKGRNSFRTDFVVFDCPAKEVEGLSIDEEKEHIVLIAEIKRDNIDAVEAKAMQVKPAMAFIPDASALGVYSDDVEQRLFYFVEAGKKRTIEEVPINKIPEWGGHLESTLLTYPDLQPAKNLLKTFRQLEDVLHSQVVDKSKRFNILLQLLLAKIYDEHTHEQSTNALNIQDFSISKLKDASVRREMDKILEKAVRYYRKYLPEKVPNTFSVDGSLLRRVCKLLAPIRILGSRRDVIQDFYMYFAKGLYKWELAQYFTPTEVVDCVVEVINPQPGEQVKDPACGSADFLISTLRWAVDRDWDASDSIFGADNSSQAAQVSVLNMVLHGDGKSNIATEDSLQRVDKHVNEFDIMLCNPPFGTRIKEERPEILRKFDLGHEWIKGASGWEKTSDVLDGQETGILFTELCVRQAIHGGRIGIVVPNGYLGNRSPRYAAFRKWLLLNVRVVSIISLPRFTFKKSGADVSASLLFLEKRKKGLKKLVASEKYRFHVGLVTSVGWSIVKYPTRIYAKDPDTGALLHDDNNEPITDADFKDVIADLLRSDATASFKWLLENRVAPAGPGGWSVPISEILANPDLVLDPKRLNRKFVEVRSTIESRPHFRLGDVMDIVPENTESFEPSESYRYVEIGDVWDGGYTGTMLRGWQLPSRARHTATEGNIFIGKIWNSVNKWFMAGGKVDDLVVTNGFYRLEVKPGEEVRIPDVIAGLCSEAYKTQMRGFATGSDGLAEIIEADALNVILPILQTAEARAEAERHITMYLKGHSTLREFIGDLETNGIEYPSVPARKSVFVQV